MSLCELTTIALHLNTAKTKSAATFTSFKLVVQTRAKSLPNWDIVDSSTQIPRQCTVWPWQMVCLKHNLWKTAEGQSDCIHAVLVNAIHVSVHSYIMSTYRNRMDALWRKVRLIFIIIHQTIRDTCCPTHMSGSDF